MIEYFLQDPVVDFTGHPYLGLIATALLSVPAWEAVKAGSRGLRGWLLGIERKETSVLASVLDEKNKAVERAEIAEEERDIYRRQVARRDFILLSRGIELPDDGEDEIARRRPLPPPTQGGSGVTG